jgi:hypothetical protein
MPCLKVWGRTWAPITQRAAVGPGLVQIWSTPGLGLAYELQDGWRYREVTSQGGRLEDLLAKIHGDPILVLARWYYPDSSDAFGKSYQPDGGVGPRLYRYTAGWCTVTSDYQATPEEALIVWANLITTAAEESLHKSLQNLIGTKEVVRQLGVT